MHPFTHPCGPKRYIPERPINVFSLLFNDALVDSIVRETNRYAAQEIGSGGKQWTTSAQEIRAYFGFMILMGVNRLPEIRDFWSTNPVLHYAPIADRISRDRFEEITRYLHFVDNRSLPARGPPIVQQNAKGFTSGEGGQRGLQKDVLPTLPAKRR